MKFDTGTLYSPYAKGSPIGSRVYVELPSPFDYPGGDGGGDRNDDQYKDVGKGEIDMTDPASIGETLGSFGDAVGGLIGGIGSIGIPGGPNIGGVVDTVTGPAQFGLEVGLNALGAAGEALSWGSRQVEREFGAKYRLREALKGGVEDGPLTAADTLGTSKRSKLDLPDDIEARLEAGENIDVLAEELVARGQGWSNDPVKNITANIIFDPLNFVAPGAGAALRGVKAAGMAVKGLKAAEEIGVGERFVGSFYNAASRGLSAGGQRLMDGVLGPTTSGVFHALGTKPYFAIKNGLGKLAPEYASRYDDAFARGAAQLPRAVIARYMADEAVMTIKAYGQKALDALPGDIGGTIEARLSSIRKVGRDQIERRTEELLARVAPDFLGYTPEALAAETAQKLAQITGASVEDAARVLGKVNIRTAQHVHLAFYGKAGDDLARAKAAASTAKNIDTARVVIVAPDTLTDDAAQAILDGSPDDLIAAVDRYSTLRNRFAGTQFDHDAVREFIGKLKAEDALPAVVKAPTTGKNALPPALRKWRSEYADSGYDLGFAPKDGWKTIVDPDTGDVMYADPFVHFVSEADPLTHRNPLGRFMDGLFRGTTQTQLIADSRARMVQFTRGTGISANEARAVHRAVLQRAADEATTPRGLSLFGSGVYHDTFRNVLGDAKYGELVKVSDPDFLVMKAFEGNLSRVGLTQKFTGKIKTATSGRGNMAAAVAEGIYPTVRFRLSPLFQAQELTESPFFNALRGIKPRTMDPDIVKVYEELADLPDFQYLTEAGYFLHLAGNGAVTKTMGRNTILGKALARFPNVKAFKERNRAAQVFAEHGENFQNAVNDINPRFWRAMTEAYKTTDARIIADRFLQERMALASGNMDEAMAVFDAAKPIMNGHDAETVWQAFRESFRQSSEQAFKTHYFNPTRGFLERTINHPYLGIYPASYMWGKVLPEFARFLLVRPFGLNAPLVGYAALTRVQQTVLAQVAADPEFAKALEANKDLVYLVEALVPGSPTNLPAHLPAWARHLSADALSGRKIDPESIAIREAGDMAQYSFGPYRTLSTVLKGLGDAGDIFAQLTRAAEEYDNVFPRSVPVR